MRARLELPGYSTLDELVARIRARSTPRCSPGSPPGSLRRTRRLIDGLLEVDPVRRRSEFDRLKTVRVRRRALREDHRSTWPVGRPRPADMWLAGVLPAKVAHFAGEARDTDVADLASTRGEEAGAGGGLIRSVVNTRDEIATMLCKRMAGIHKRAREQLEELREEIRADPNGCWTPLVRCWRWSGRRWGLAGEEVSGEGSDADSRRCAPGRAAGAGVAGTAPAGWRRCRPRTRSHRSSRQQLPAVVERFCRLGRRRCSACWTCWPSAASADTSLFDAIRFLRSNRGRAGEFIPR